MHANVFIEMCDLVLVLLDLQVKKLDLRLGLLDAMIENRQLS